MKICHIQYITYIFVYTHKVYTHFLHDIYKLQFKLQNVMSVTYKQIIL